MDSHQAQLLADWRHFIRGGFRYQDLSGPLYHYLAEQCDLESLTYEDRKEFWEYWFNTLYGLNTFLTELYETRPDDVLREALQAEMDGLYYLFKEVLDEFEWEVYQDFRDAEITAWVDQEQAKHPNRSRAEIEQELTEYYDLCMQDAWYSDVYMEMDLDETIHQALADLAPDALELTWQPSVFDLQGWLDTNRQASPAGQQPQLAVQATLFERARTADVGQRRQPHNEAMDAAQGVLVEPVSITPDPVEAETAPGDADPADEALIAETTHPDLEAIKRRLAATPEELAEYRAKNQAKRQVAKANPFEAASSGSRIR